MRKRKDSSNEETRNSNRPRGSLDRCVRARLAWRISPSRMARWLPSLPRRLLGARRLQLLAGVCRWGDWRGGRKHDHRQKPDGCGSATCGSSAAGCCATASCRSAARCSTTGCRPAICRPASASLGRRSLRRSGTSQRLNCPYLATWTLRVRLAWVGRGVEERRRRGNYDTVQGDL